MVISIGIAVILFFLFSKKDIFVEDESSSDNALLMADETEDQKSEDNINNESSVVIIDVKGEVNDPGVYELSDDARARDVIDLAGGFTDEADEVQVNLAEKVHDEMAIIVPKEGEDLPVKSEQADIDTENEAVVRINNASKEEIETLPGIGPSKAETIITYREENGSFQSEEDLLDISGIGEKTLENIRDHIQVP